jgi:NitT/TauT family transport system substrate-binding protein
LIIHRFVNRGVAMMKLTLAAGIVAGTLLASAAGPLALAQTAPATTNIRATLDIIRYGGNAPFDDAEAKGYFAQHGFHVTWDPSKGSQDAVVRVASGVASVGVADVSTLIDFAGNHPDKSPKVVFIIMDHSPQVIISMSKSNIRKPSDLIGRTLASAQTDGASKMFPAFLKLNKVDMAQVKRDIVDIRLRDPMLARGTTEGIIGYDYTAVFNLKALDVKTEDLSLLYYADHGLDLYGQAVIVAPDFLAREPETVKNLVRGIAKAWVDAVADPAPAIKTVAALEPTTRVELETARLKWLIDHEVVTPNTRKNGLGAYDPARMQFNIDMVSQGLNLPVKPKVADVYDDRFMPPFEDRRLPKGS